MKKPRNKSELRQYAAEQIAILRHQQLQERRRDWRANVIDALQSGSTIQGAAMLSGVKRSRIYGECRKNRAFEQAVELARDYAYYDLKHVGVRIWPPIPPTVQRPNPSGCRV